MTYKPHLLLAVGGRLGTGGEIWTQTLRLDSNSSDLEALQTTAEDQIDEIKGYFTTLFTDTRGRYSSAAHFDWIKLNAIGPDGRYGTDRPTNIIENDPGTAPVGPLGAGPYQVALCITFDTLVPRGRAARGRTFTPVGALGVDTNTGTISSINASDTAAAWAAFLNAINDNPGLDVMDVHAAVISNLGDPGPANGITGVRVGRVLDTQRRRRAQLEENYSDPVVVTW